MQNKWQPYLILLISVSAPTCILYNLVNRACDYRYLEANQAGVDMGGDLISSTQLCSWAKIAPVVRHDLLLRMDKDTSLALLPIMPYFRPFSDEVPGMCLDELEKPRQLSWRQQLIRAFSSI
jgi:hypothetical protein